VAWATPGAVALDGRSPGPFDDLPSPQDIAPVSSPRANAPCAAIATRSMSAQPR
jgi:hypothetical protein